jgi:Domain of unknown function (DUF1707)
MAMDDRIRTSDADRERVTARLRDHFAEGRLTREELDERITAALSARTFGELRRVMTDLPEPAPVLPQAGRLPRPAYARRRGPGMLPLAALLLVAAVLIPGGGWLFLAFLQMILVFALVVGLGTAFAAHRFRRRMRRHWELGHVHYQSWSWPGGY